jgi:hypothetical protein
MVDYTKPIAIAPAHVTEDMKAANGGQTPPLAMTYACQTCTRRKVKCDKLSPICSTCHKAKLECSYQAPPPRRRKRKTSGDLSERLAYYERILQQNGLLTEDPGSNAPSVPSVSSEASQQALPHHQSSRNDPDRNGRLLSGGGTTRYVDSNLWRNLGEEEMSRIADDDDDEVDETPIGVTSVNQLASDPLSGAFLGLPQNLLNFHPCAAHAKILWQAHIDNVEPICKVLHIPTVATLVENGSQHPYYISKADECILFAIYHFAVVSLSDESCQQSFGQTRDTLRIRYHNALRQALINASFLRTTQIPVLQAFVLYLLSTRHQNDPQTFWMMTGAAVRIAQRIGLHKDAESLGLPPFDVQMRRRLFCQILPLDGYASQISGTGITLEPGSWNVKQPLNLNDDQIWPGMTHTPEEQKGATEMIFFLARAEIGSWYLKAMQGKYDKPPLYNAFSRDGIGADKSDLVDEMESMIEAKYLRYCDLLNPLHTLLLIMARSAANAGRLRMKLPALHANTASNEERREVCNIAVKIIDTDIAAYANPSLVRFMWHIRAFFQWDALVCMLISMTKPGLLQSVELETAWQRIQTVFNNHTEILERNKLLSTAICRTTLKAWDANPPAFAAGGEPTFVQTLRTYKAQSERKRQRSAYADGAFGSTETTTPIEPSPSSDLKSFEQNGGDVFDFGLDNDFTFDSADFLFWDKLIQDYRNVPEDQSGSYLQ